MNVDPEDGVFLRGPRYLQEPQEEADEARVAIHEDDSVGPAVRLVLRALAPVGDGAGDNQLAFGQFADLGPGGLAGGDS